MVNGLWGSSDSMVLDFATIVQRQALLGFNAVRLPFSFKNLFGGSLQSFTQSCNVDTQDSIVKGDDGSQRQRRHQQSATPPESRPHRRLVCATAICRTRASWTGSCGSCVSTPRTGYTSSSTITATSTPPSWRTRLCGLSSGGCSPR